MENTFTPGPWEIGKHATPEHSPQFGIYAGAAARDHVIVKGEHAEADARLIAAAPELLEALQSLLQMDVKGHQLQDRLQFSPAGRAILEPARAAIAKATQ